MSSPDQWSGILENGEEILWQGRPQGSHSFLELGIYPIIAGPALFVLALALKVILPSWWFSELYPPEILRLLSLIFWSGGWTVLGGNYLIWRCLEYYTWYTLTNKRAFIATAYPGFHKKLYDYQINGDTYVQLVEAERNSVYFAWWVDENDTRREITRPTDDEILSIQLGGLQPDGFKDIPDARYVYSLMKNIQSKAQARGNTA